MLLATGEKRTTGCFFFFFFCVCFMFLFVYFLFLIICSSFRWFFGWFFE